MVVETDTMAVRAYLGSVDINDARRFGHVDMITAMRSPGSTLKPFLYGMAMDAGLIHSRVTAAGCAATLWRLPAGQLFHGL